VGNTCQGNSSPGINLSSSGNNTVVGNTCQGNSSCGIGLYSSSNNTIVGNTCQGNSACGIYFYSSSNNTITGNTVLGNSQITDNTYDGICVDADSDYNIISGNLVRHQGLTKQQRYGINVNSFNGDGNVVVGNDLYLSGRTAGLNDAGTGTVLHLSEPVVPVIAEVARTGLAADSTGVKWTSAEVLLPPGAFWSAAVEATWTASNADSVTAIELYDATAGAVKASVSGNAGTNAKSSYARLTPGNRHVVRVNVTTASATAGATTDVTKAVIYIRPNSNRL
jgi:parallel beta-helix repeat protein